MKWVVGLLALIGLRHLWTHGRAFRDYLKGRL